MRYLSVIIPFADYRIGDVITDADEIERIGGENPSFVVPVRPRKPIKIVSKPETAAEEAKHTDKDSN